MIYLQRYTTAEDGSQIAEIAAVEDAQHAGRYEACGYARCTPEAFRAAWRQRDARSIEKLRTSVLAAAREVGGRPRIYTTVD
jgi:hypothetical protein